MNLVKLIYSAIRNLLDFAFSRRNHDSEEQALSGEPLLSILFRGRKHVIRDHRDQSLAELLIYARTYSKVENLSADIPGSPERVSYLQVATLYGTGNPPIGLNLIASKSGLPTGLYKYVETVTEGKTRHFGVHGSGGTDLLGSSHTHTAALTDYTEDSKEYQIDPQLSSITVIRDDDDFLEGNFVLGVLQRSNTEFCSGTFRVPKRRPASSESLA